MTDIAMGPVTAEGQHSAHRKHIPSTGKLVVSGFVFAVGLLAAVGAFAASKGLNLSHFTRDPVSVMGGAPYIGVVSNIGVMLWLLAAASALTAGLLGSALGCGKLARNFLLGTGLLTLVLGLDDLFLLHEEILPRLGVPQKVILVAYLAAGMLYTLVHHKHILRGQVVLFVISGFFLGTSLAIDFIFPYSEIEASIEDGAKFIGIVFWFLFVIASVNQIRLGIRSR